MKRTASMVGFKGLRNSSPPPSIADFAIPSLIKTGFPQRAAEGSYLNQFVS